MINRKEPLQAPNFDGKTFYFFTVGKEDHDKPSHKFYVKESLVKFDKDAVPYIQFPMFGVFVRVSEKGTKTIVEGDFNLYNIFFISFFIYG